MRYLQKIKEITKFKADAKDKKIMHLLASNARMPLTQLAKKVALSRDAVNYRIRNYEKLGVIQGYRTLVNISKFDYDNYHIFIKLNNPAKATEDKVIAKLAKIPNIRAILKFSGNYDLEIALIAKDLNELDSLITRIRESCGDLIQDYEILALVKTYLAESFPKSFIEEYDLQKNQPQKEYNPDKKDIQILKIIGEEATLSLAEIGGKTGLSADAVAYRIKNLVNSGIIVKFIPVINYASLDYNLHAVLLNISSLDKENEKKLAEFFTSNKNPLWAVKCIGRFNVLIYFLVRDTEDLQKTLIELRSLFPKHITNYESLLAYEEYKYVYFPKELF
jgi:Lrp/AsnC family leucine-responsive transcriptional regulator